MSGTAVFVALLGLVASLFLAVRGLKGFRLSNERKLAMAGIWLIVIVALAFVLQRALG